MNNDHKFFLTLLSSAIGSTPIQIGASEKPDWELIYRMALAHEVHTLLYPVLDQLDEKLLPHDYLKDQWHKKVLLSGLNQQEMADCFIAISEAFHKEGVPLIAYKGISLRRLYPYPELRTMKDIDILVAPENLKKAEIIMQGLGYIEKLRDDRVISYINRFEVELHRYILRPNQYSRFSGFENLVWNHTQKVKMNNMEVYLLENTLELAFLILHFFIHYSEKGVGVRQLCDIALYAKAYEKDIDWNQFCGYIQEMGIEYFALYLFEACRKYFTLDIDNYCSHSNRDIQNEYLEIFMIDILNNGVFGGKHIESSIEKLLIKKRASKEGYLKEPRIQQNIRLIQEVFFPSSQKIGTHYRYAKKRPFLLPFAWIHRIIHVLHLNHGRMTLYLRKLLILMINKKKLDYYQSIGLIPELSKCCRKGKNDN